MTDEAEETYDGVFGAFPYALRQSESRLFKLYAVVGGLLGVVLTFYFGAALAVQVANTLGSVGGRSPSFGRSTSSSGCSWSRPSSPRCCSSPGGTAGSGATRATTC
ncbi:hypothetical protein [Haloarchaeobius sp. HME9146]|uniref:hypothetical protein n=1 Tax=Haloarchaeobius sp. HME9146 TaxID=2978732 RepID=UPI0021C22161|nr:hypothetical protein [Haloarchaeobius sp. HME9146]MCT9094402.1 hypothetical protein [Haloarchaeobius sp. HME9146]